jgi:hypothetical protein
MTHTQQLLALEGEIKRVINQFAHEFDLTICDAIGALELIKLELYRRHTKAREAQQNDEEGYAS